MEGHFCPSNTTTRATMLVEHVCPAGMVCAAGRDHAPDLVDDACPAGFYCLAGDISPTPQGCLPGTYQPFTGAQSNSECLICPRGELPEIVV